MIPASHELCTLFALCCVLLWFNYYQFYPQCSVLLHKYIRVAQHTLGQLGQLYNCPNCPSACWATFMNLGKYVACSSTNIWFNQNRTQHGQTMCMFYGLYSVDAMARHHQTMTDVKASIIQMLGLSYYLRTGTCLNMKTIFLGIGIPIIRIRWLWDWHHLNFTPAFLCWKDSIVLKSPMQSVMFIMRWDIKALLI